MHDFTLPTEDDSKFRLTIPGTTDKPEGKMLVLDAFDLNLLQSEAAGITQQNKDTNFIPHFRTLFNKKYQTNISLSAAMLLCEKCDEVTDELKKKLSTSPEPADSSTSTPPSKESAKPS